MLTAVLTAVLTVVLTAVPTLPMGSATARWAEGTYETEDHSPLVEQGRDGRVYGAGGGDELVGARIGWDGELNRITSLSFSQLLQMPSGEFLIPVVEEEEEENQQRQQQQQQAGGAGRISLPAKIIKMLRVEVIRPEAFVWRPTKRAERARMMPGVASVNSKEVATAEPTQTLSQELSELTTAPAEISL